MICELVCRNLYDRKTNSLNSSASFRTWVQPQFLTDVMIEYYQIGWLNMAVTWVEEGASPCPAKQLPDSIGHKA